MTSHKSQAIIGRWLLLLGLGIASPLGAVEFGAGLRDTHWEVEGDIFACEFRQPIPHYGEAVFFHRAGEDVEFYLDTRINRMQPGRADLAVEAPAWQSSALARDLGQVPVQDGERWLPVESERALAMLAALESGMAPAFSRTGRGMAEPIRLKLSPVQFRQNYPAYRDCVAELLPVNFSQVERTALYYDRGVDSLDAENRSRLDDIVTYVTNDPDVAAIYIEGHSDNQDARFDSRRRSERRALKVRDYLVERGLDPRIMLVDYHGDRYPVASNDTPEGRALNRRATIRLERVELDR